MCAGSIPAGGTNHFHHESAGHYGLWSFTPRALRPCVSIVSSNAAECGTIIFLGLAGYHVSTFARFLCCRGAGVGTVRRPFESQNRVSAGSMTSSTWKETPWWIARLRS